MKKTTNKKITDFIHRAQIVHLNKNYDYSLWTEYDGTTKAYHQKNIPVCCLKHGKFLVSLSNHLRGSGCPECAKEVRASKRRKSVEYYISKAKKVHGNKYDYSKWTSVKNTSVDKVKIICKKHGVFEQTPADHIRKKAGCPNCVRDPLTRQKQHPAQRHIPLTIYEHLDDSNWLRHQHLELKKSIPQIARELKVSESLVTSKTKKHNINIQRYQKSSGERELCSFLDSLNVEYKTSDRLILHGRELDILIPSHNLAIEYNGLFWHSEYNGKDQCYHLNKTIECEKQGIRLLQIFEDEWRDQKQKCKDTIKHLLGKSIKGHYGRQVTIREISWKEAKSFLDQFHLLNAGISGNFRCGAFKDNELIAVMVFGHQNNEYSPKDVVELRRFVTNKKNNPGVGSKIFKWAVDKKGYKKIIAFVDRRWFTGLIKTHIGFSVVGVTKPSVWWTDGHYRFHRRFKTKKSLLKEYDFSSNSTKQHMLEKLGYYRIWDCGKLKLEYVTS